MQFNGILPFLLFFWGFFFNKKKINSVFRRIADSFLSVATLNKSKREFFVCFHCVSHYSVPLSEQKACCLCPPCPLAATYIIIWYLEEKAS